MKDVRYEKSAQEACDAALEKWERADEAIQIIEWVILRDEKIGDPLFETGNIRTVTVDGARSAHLPKVTILYEITDTVIVFHSMNFEDATYAQAGRA